MRGWVRGHVLGWESQRLGETFEMGLSERLHERLGEKLCKKLVEMLDPNMLPIYFRYASRA